MKTSSGKILTTHTGSLPRPSSLSDIHDPKEVRGAVEETVGKQVTAGIDVVGDGEMSKPSYATYITERLSGFGGEPVAVPRWGYEEFPDYAVIAAMASSPGCNGPVAYLDLAPVRADIANLSAAAAGQSSVTEAFMTAASPGVIDMFMPNQYYSSTEEYLMALADAMKSEYDAIYQGGLILQLDCPDLACSWSRGKKRSVEEFRNEVSQRLAVLDYATRDIPGEAMGMHLCWGNWEGPHHTDIPVGDIIDLVLKARPHAISFEGANPRHEHEWQIFEELKLPEGKVIVPGVIDSTTNYIEHPELVAQRICRYAEIVGRENVIAGVDCGFATSARSSMVRPEIAWAKLATLSEGAQIASQRLWG
jgi:5-methyltetrahydropteroyltriglutamate--homocysteine methyltransferase